MADLERRYVEGEGWQTVAVDSGHVTLKDVTIEPDDPAVIPLTVTGAAGQINNLVRVWNENSYGLLVYASGAVDVLPDPAASAAQALYLEPGAPGTDALVVQAGGGQTLVIDPDGYLLVATHAAPADAALDAGEVALWFDQTNGAAKLMLKGKQADGTVVTGQVVLS